MTEERTVAFRVLVGPTDDEYNELDSLVDEYNRLCDGLKKPPAAAVALKPRITELHNLVTRGLHEGRFRKESFIKWEAFKAQFPPRVAPGWKAPEDNPDAPPDLVYEDSVWGVDLVSYSIAAVREYMVPKMTDAEWAEFEPHVSGGDWRRLGIEILVLNERPVGVPKLPWDSTETTRPNSA